MNTDHEMTSNDTTECLRHGTQGYGIACIHVAEAIDSGEKVGFFWSPDPEMARPFAWCAACERYLNQNGGDLQKLAKIADFKMICATCWDEAKAVLYDQGRT
jgi:hypothetical protein